MKWGLPEKVTDGVLDDTCRQWMDRQTRMRALSGFSTNMASTPPSEDGLQIDMAKETREYDGGQSLRLLKGRQLPASELDGEPFFLSFVLLGASDTERGEY